MQNGVFAAVCVLLVALIAGATALNVAKAPALRDQQAILAQTRDKIVASRGSLNATTIGDTLSGEIDFVFKSSNGITVGLLNITITNDVLTVWGKTKAWDNVPVVATFIFYFASATSTDLQIQVQLQVSNLTYSLASIYTKLFGNGGSAGSFLSQLRGETSAISFAYSSTDYNGVSQGVTLDTTTVISQASGSLLAAFKTLKPTATAGSAAFDTHAYFRDLNDYNIKLNYISSQGFVLSSNVRVESYSVVVSGSSSPASTSIDLQGTFSTILNSQNVQFSAEAAWTSSTTTFTFNGALQSSWANAFGFSWLTLTQGNFALTVGSAASVDSFAVTAQAVTTFSSSPASLSLQSTGTGNFFIVLNNVPLASGATLSRVFNAVASKLRVPGELGQLAVTNGQVSFSIANYASSNARQGLDLSASVAVATGGSVARALSVLQSSATRVYNFDLFVPIFSTNVEDISLTVTESGTFALTQAVSVNDYQLAITVADQTSSSSVSLSGELAVTVEGQSTPLLFDVVSNWQEQPDDVKFTGSLKNVWNHPFGLSWLTIDTATITLDVQSGSTPRFSIDASGDVSWSTSTNAADITVDINQSGGYIVSVTGITFGGANARFSSVVSAITNGAAAPLVLEQVQSSSTSGTVGFTLASYSSGNYQQGFTLTAQAVVAAASELDQASRVIDPHASASRTYAFNLFVPVYSQAPEDITFTLQETGAIALTSALSLNGYQLKVDVTNNGQSFDLSASTVASVSLQGQSSPAVFDLSAQWESSNSEFVFTGSLQSGTWTNPLGLSWMSITAASISLTLAESTPVDTLSISATADLAFSPNSAVGVVFNVKGDGNAMFAVNNLPLSSLAVMFITITQGSEVPKLFVGLNDQGTVSVAVSTYAGTYQKGFTLSGQVTLGEGQMKQAAKELDASAGSRTWSLQFFSPIFGPAPAYDVDVTITETGAFSLGSVTVDSFSVSADVSGSNSALSLFAELSFPLAHQPQPVTFSVSGSWQEQSGVSLSGNLVGSWPSPFGLDWLTINSASASIQVSSGDIASSSFSASGSMGPANDKVDASFSISTTGSNFVVTARTQATWNYAAIAQMVVGRDVSLLDDIIRSTSSGSLELMVSIASANQGSTLSGVTFSAKGNLQGDLFNHVKALSPKSSQLNSGLTFNIDVNFPIFSSDPLDVSLTVSVDENIPITDNLSYESLTLSLTVAPLAISASVDFQATFKRNPTLNFDIGGSIAADGSFTMTGEMIGSWDNVFGFKYFDLSNVILEFGINPDMCEVDFCVSDLGLGFEMQLGTKTIKFDGNAAAPDFEDMFVSGSITGNNGMALTVMDIVLEWNKMFPNWAIPTNDVPQNWGIADTSFYFAPDNGHFGNIYYTEGFGFTGGINILEMDLDFSVNCTEANADWCNFAFNVNIDLNAYSQWIKHELELKGYKAYTFEEATAAGISTAGSVHSDPTLVVFRVNSVSLSQFSAQQLSQQVNPKWLVNIDVFDKNHQLDFDTDLSWLTGSFHQYFDKWLAWLFHLN